MDAAMKPLLADQKTVEGACECIPIIEPELDDHPLHVQLATMSIVKDYYEKFQILRRTSESNLSSIMPIDVGLMKNIQTILTILGRPLQQYNQIDMDDIIRAHLSKIKQNPAVEADVYDRSVESALKCFRAMYTIEFKCYHSLWTGGFEFLSKLLVAHDRGLDGQRVTKTYWVKLTDITRKIPNCALSTVPDPAFVDKVVERFRATLDKNETDSGKSANTDTK